MSSGSFSGTTGAVAWRLVTILLSLALMACGGGSASTVLTPGPAWSEAEPYPAGLSNASLTVAGITRQYRVHVPPALASSPVAVVLVLHGGGGQGMDVSETGTHPLAVFRTVADREGFVAVYPGGLPAADGRPGWNDCRGDNLLTSGADDLAFLDALIDRLRAQYALPASRIFMAGGSNGAQMTLAYAVTRSQRLAAVASSGGSLPLNPRPGECSGPPAGALPVLLAHGSADTQMPYDGGCVADVGGGCARGRVISAQATLDFWRAVNGLAGATPVQTVEDPDASDAGPAFRFRFNGLTPVEWWRLYGAGHTVPSRTVLIEPNALTGVQSRDVEFAELAWSFFKSTWVAN